MHILLTFQEYGIFYNIIYNIHIEIFKHILLIKYTYTVDTDFGCSKQKMYYFWDTPFLLGILIYVNYDTVIV